MKNKAYSYDVSFLSSLFAPNVIKELAKFGYSYKFNKILKHFIKNNYDLPIENKVSNLYDYIYKRLQVEYPNEYIYKNALAKNILLGIHSLNTSFMINELRVKDSKIDSVIINGTLTAYEIKTKYDNLNRLQKQLEDYKTAFEKIYVIVDKEFVDEISYIQNEGIGILTLNKNGTISTVKKASSQMKYIELSSLFDILRKDEYLYIIKKLTKKDIDVPNSQIYTCAKKVFVTLEKEQTYKEVVKVLKKRGDNIILKNFIQNVPNSLKARAIETNFTLKEKKNFLSILETKTKILIEKGM